MADPTFPASPAWTFPLRCRQDELLSSWLCRSAHLHGAMPYGFMSARFPGTPVWNRDVDLFPTPDLITAVDLAAGLREGSAMAMTLSTAAAVLGLPIRADARGHVPFVLSAGIFHRSRRRHGLQFCPECLDEDVPCFRLWGRLAFVVACPRHRTPVLDGCPRCDAPVMPHRAPVRALRTCHACGSDLGRVRPASPPPDGLAEASHLQDLCLSALAAPDSPGAIPGTTGRDLLALARAVTAVVAGAGSPGRASGEGRWQVEMMRVAERVSLLARVGRLLADWPACFRSDAPGLGLSQRTFVRRDLPPALADEVGRLPTGSSRRRARWRSVVDDPAMRRLRRSDTAAYRAARARRLLLAASAA